MHQLVQYLDSDGTRRVGVLGPDATTVAQLSSTDSIYALMHRGLHERRTLEALVDEFCTTETVSLDELVSEKRLLPAFDHPVLSERSLNWLQGEVLSRLAPFADAAEPPDASSCNTRVYTVDIHQHPRLVGYTNVTLGDTPRISAVLELANPADAQQTETPVAGMDVTALETDLNALGELRHGDVHFQVFESAVTRQ